jgi:fibronectin-binding autotransporter adhesin
MKKQIPTVRSFVQSACRFWPAVLSAMLLCVSSASAQVLTWDPGHTPATGSDGSGSWNTTGTKSTLLTNWSNGSADVPWSDGPNVVIGAGVSGATITIKAAIMVNNITFNQESSGAYTLTGAFPVTFTGGTNEVDNTSGTTVYKAITLAGSVGFTKTGNGTLEFSSVGTPTFTGGPLHIVAGGIMIASADWVYSSADLSVDSGANFDMNGRNATVGALIGGGTIADTGSSARQLTTGGNNNGGTFTGSIGVAGITFVKNGTGVEILGGSASVSSTTTIVTNGTLLDNASIAGAVNVSSTSIFGGTGSVGGKVTYASGAQAEFSSATPMTISGALVANGNTVNLNLPANLADGNYTLANYNATGSSGSFATTPVVLTGSFADAGAVVAITTGSGQVVLSVQPCTAAGVSQSPASTTAFIGNTATFTVVATGSSPTYDWQVNTGSGFNDVSDGTGQGTPTYTTHTLTSGDNNTQYRCVISVACDSTTQPSGAATLTVVDPSSYSFRSIGSGNWNNPGTWQQSPDGVTWSAATATPFAGNSNILIQAGNTVTVTAAVAIDHTVIQAGGEVDVSGTTLTITGASTPDVDVSGNLELLDVAGSAVAENGTPVVKFENGGAFVSQLHTATAVPTATWATNSTCSISPASAGAAAPTGLAGQTFGNFVWNWPSQTASVILGSTLTSVAGDFDVTASNTLTLTTSGDASTYTLTVGGLIDIKSGGGSGKGKLAVAGGAPTGNNTIQMGAGLDIESGGNFDLGNHSTNQIGGVTLEMTGNSQITLAGALLNSQSGSYLIDAGHTLTLNNNISVVGGRSVTVNGTLNFQANQVIAGTNGGALVINSTGTIVGNGTGQLTTGLGSVTYGGTLNINQASLTGLSSGQGILLFGATSYTGSFTSIIPATPPGFASWDTSQMDISGTLVVSGSVSISPKIITTVLSGGNLTISGTGAPVSDGFTVFGSGNLTTPRSSWTSTGVTGTSDASGNFSATINSATSAGAFQFYTVHFN